ncbi:MAG: glycosyl hydrolase family 18 protein, partial [Actinomycetes bacterium]
MVKVRWLVASALALTLASVGAVALAGSNGERTLSTGTAEVTPATSLSPLSDRRVVTGWISYWDLEEGLASVLDHPSLLAEVSPFWYRITKASQVQPMDGNNRPESDLIDAIDQLHAAGIAAYPSVKDDGFGGHEMAQLLGDKQSRRDLVNALVDMSVRTGADGVDIDFEEMNYGGSGNERTAVKRLYPIFLAQLQSKLHALNKVLSVAVPARRSASDNNWETVDYNAIGKVVDRARVMTYDYSTDRPGPIGPIDWTRKVAEYAHREFRGVPLSIGVPAYGRNWYLKTLRGSCPSAAKTTVAPTTEQAFDLANKYGADITWSKDAGEYHFDYRRPYPEYGKCVVMRRVWFEEARSAEERLLLAERLGVQGISVFTFGFEDPKLWARARGVATSINPDPAKVSVTAPATATSGDTITINGRVTVKGTPVTTKTVSLQKRVPGKAWRDVVDLVTDD